MISATQIRKGMILIHDGDPHRVLDFQHRTPGKGTAIVRARLRNLRTGASYEHRFNSQEGVDRAILDQQEMEYLYQQNSLYYFMNTATFEQFPIDQEILGDFKNYLQEGATVQVEFFEEQPITIEFPAFVELKVVETEPELKGATANNSPKPATLETGVVVQVPPFIRPGDTIRVDPNEGRYLERAK
ncbi:MAG: elongation factor P [Acidobacteriota bacterium]|nr:elongation factor P [Acidobacteriota bacterium]